MALTTSAELWRGRRVLVTGHTGFKGAWLALWLQHLGARVSGLALVPDSELGAFRSLAPWPDLVSATADLRDEQAVAATLAESDPEVLFHLGAQPFVRRGWADPAGTYATNVMGTVNVLAGLRRCPSARAAVVVTSDKVYAGIPGTGGFVEDDPLGGRDPYSGSKVCAEVVVASWRQSGLASGVAMSTARAGNVIGGGDLGQDRLLPDILRALVAGEPVRLRYPRATRPWQFVLEPLHGYMGLAERLLTSPEAAPPAVNFGPQPGSAVEVAEVVERVLGLWGCGQWELDDGLHVPEARVLELSSDLAGRVLGWRPRSDLDTALEWTVAWWRAQQSGEDMRKVSLGQIEAYERMAGG